MDPLAELFETNRIIVLSVYGQVFFVMGLAIAFQGRRRSELPLARSLIWLAGFGILHGLMVWGYMFIPLQAGLLPAPMVEALLLLQLALKPIAFGMLFQFGIELLISTRPGQDRDPHIAGQPWLRFVPLAVLGCWVVGTTATSVILGQGFVPGPGPWLPSEGIDAALAATGPALAVGDVLARAWLCLPGSLVVAVGLRRTVAQLGSVAEARVATAMTAAATAFVAFAVLGGLVPLEAPFPPASIVNDRTFLEVVGIPVEVFRSLDGLAIALAIISSLALFERETDRQLADARRRELLLRERERIARDLHDGIIQSIYAAGLHLEQAAAEADEASRARIGTVMTELDRVTEDLRGAIFDLGSGDLRPTDAESIVLAVADELQAHTLVRLEVSPPNDHLPTLSPDLAEQLHRFVTEAFSNVLRHARADAVQVRIECDGRTLRIEITDDGIGFDPSAPPGRDGRGLSRGIANMRRRAELLDGRFDLRSAPSHGTSVSLTIPVATTSGAP